MAVDPSQLWGTAGVVNGQGYLNPYAAPIIPVSALQYQNNPGFQDQSGQWIGGSQGWMLAPGTANPYGGGDNFAFWGDEQSGPSLTIKSDGEYAGMNTQYVKSPDGQYWMPQTPTGTQFGRARYGTNFWVPATMAATAGLGSYFGAAGAAAEGAGGAAGGAAAGSGAAGLTSAEAGAMMGGGEAAAGSGVAGGAAGGGAAAGTAAGNGGLFGTGLTGQQAVQLGSLAAGLLGGGGSGSGGGGSGNPYAGTNPMIPLSQLQPMQARSGPLLGSPSVPTGANYPTNSMSADIWRQYSQGLLGPRMATGAPVGGIGTEVPALKPGGRPSGRQPGILDARPVQRTGGY